MINLDLINLPETPAWLAGGITLLRGIAASATLQAYLTAGLGTPVRYAYRAATDRFPAWAYFKKDDYFLLLLDGASTEQMVSNIWNGYVSPITVEHLGLVHPEFYAWAAFLNDQLFQAGAAGIPSKIHIAGWSMGGATAYHIPLLLPFALVSAVKNITTFGAPRSLEGGNAVSLNGMINSVRWMNSDDPVPLVPPRGSDSPAALLAYGQSAAYRWQRFRHPLGGVNIDPLGFNNGALLPSNANISFVGSAVAWFYGFLRNEVNVPHSVREYQRRIAINIVPVPIMARPFGLPEPAGNAPRREIARIEEQAVQSIFRVERQQNIEAVVIPRKIRAYAFRFNRAWYVIFNGQVIAACGGKRKARQVARRFNAFLDTLQNSAAVDLPSLILGFNDYVALASQPNNGFAPVMNTVFPALS